MNLMSIFKRYVLLMPICCIGLLSFIGCESIFTPVNPEVKRQNFIGGADVDIRSEDAIFYIQREHDDSNFWVIEYENLKNHGVNFRLIDDIADIKMPSSSSGSCFSIGRNIVVTNQHIIGDNLDVSVIYGGIQYPAEVIYLSVVNDLAVLYVDGIDFPYSFKIASSQNIKPGDDIYAIGYPLIEVLGDDVRLTTGIINAKSGIGNDKNSFQISAQIQPGNSGGPIISTKSLGTVLGIATYKLSDSYLLERSSSIAQNLNFANNCDHLLEFLEKNNFISDNTIVSSLDESFLATAIVFSEPEHGKKLKKYIFSYDIKTVQDQYVRDFRHMQSLDIKLYSIDVQLVVAQHFWRWAFDYQKAPYVLTQYKESFADFIEFLLYEKTDTIKAVKGGNHIFSTDGEGTLIGYNNAFESLGKSLVIPSSIGDEKIMTIGKYAFSESDTISSITISEGIELIDESAFYYCKNLSEVYLPSSLERIGPWALYGPSHFTIHYAGSTAQWTSLTKGLKSIDLDYCTVITEKN